MMVVGMQPAISVSILRSFEKDAPEGMSPTFLVRCGLHPLLAQARIDYLILPVRNPGNGVAVNSRQELIKVVRRGIETPCSQALRRRPRTAARRAFAIPASHIVAVASINIYTTQRAVAKTSTVKQPEGCRALLASGG